MDAGLSAQLDELEQTLGQPDGWDAGGRDDRRLAAFLEAWNARLLERLHSAEAQVERVVHNAGSLSAAVEAEVVRFDSLASSQFIENVCACTRPPSRPPLTRLPRAQRLYEDDDPAVRSLCDRAPTPPLPAPAEPTMEESLLACLAAVEGRWSPPVSEAEGGLPRLRRGRAWRALPHLIGSSAFHSDHSLGLGSAPPAGEGAGAPARRRGEDSGSDDSTSTASASSSSASSLGSAESSELTDSEAAAASSSSYEAVTDDEAVQRRRAEAGSLKGIIEVRARGWGAGGRGTLTPPPPLRRPRCRTRGWCRARYQSRARCAKK